MNSLQDVIAAIVTPIGNGGISVLRASGGDALTIIDKCFRGRRKLSSAKTHTAHVGYINDPTGEVIDQVVATVFKAPKSYTGDDTVEISCHGGALITKRILEIILHCGARQAEPGEFTKRAFLNGKIDLSQAEAVSELIMSTSEIARKTSFNQLQGRISESVKSLRDNLIKTCSLLEVELDFIEQDIQFIDRKNIVKQIEDSIISVDKLVSTFSKGKICKDGFKVTIIGQPNVGKSSLLNFLLKQDRAIVTPLPGTTRDVIEENISINGILIRLVDTAGIRESVDPVESIGIGKTWKELENSDLSILVIDSTIGIQEIELGIIHRFQNRTNSNMPRLIIVGNKSDIVLFNISKDIMLGEIPFINISAKSGHGIPSLLTVIENNVLSALGNITDSSIILTNLRHKECLEKAKNSLLSALSAISAGNSNEFIVIDIKDTISELSEIIGEITSEDLLNNIFSTFCIGK